jgi:SAM-dependent methyltransferase
MPSTAARPWAVWPAPTISMRTSSVKCSASGPRATSFSMWASIVARPCSTTVIPVSPSLPGLARQVQPTASLLPVKCVEYPEGADPRRYLKRAELRRIARELRLWAGACFVDLGCGQGGPSVWVAHATGAAVVGIDVSSVGIARATKRAQELGPADRACFEIDDITSSGLPESSFYGAVSVDVLWAVPDKARALRETARILKPGAQVPVHQPRRRITPSLRRLS